MYYLLQWTWGLLENIIGGIVFLVLIGKPHFKYKKCIATVYSETNNGSFSLGMFIFLGRKYETVIDHEYGHTLQNMMFGIAKPFIVSIPSIVRYWYKELISHKWDDYDDIWFENHATKIGSKRY